MKNILSGWAIFIALPLFAQQAGKVDTLATLEVYANTKNNGIQQVFATDFTENKLAQLPSINLVQRGGFAPEISFRGLNAFQNQITLDGMRVFGACTDRMDPITSYVEGSNLNNVSKDNTGLGGNATDCLNISLCEVNSSNNSLVEGKIFSSYQFNGGHLFSGASVNAKKGNFNLLLNGNFRKAENYNAGGGTEIPFTQFEKQNFFGKFEWNKNNQTFGLLTIIDRAQNVGYAALPMDVSRAEANIFKLYHKFSSLRFNIANNIYWNDIYHEMDDTKRPFVPIHMDMPGWSKTFGFNGKFERIFQNLRLGLNYEVFYNYRAAEMTMYPPNEIEMFMYTWAPMTRKQLNLNPFAAYYFGNFSFKYRLNHSINQDEFVDSTGMGVGQLNVFGFQVDTINSKYALSQFWEVNYNPNSNVELSYIACTGNRIPSLSELYGFYLFNSQDGYDYVGNPNMHNEGFFNNEINFKLGHQKGSVKLSVFNYHFKNYIFGAHDPSLWQMTIGANGVKIYDNYGVANISGLELTVNQKWNDNLGSFVTTSYLRGKGKIIGNLPWISPLTLRNTNWLEVKDFRFNIHQTYGVPQNNFNANFGEDATPDYYVLDLDISKKIKFQKNDLNMKIGVQNLLDSNYFTHLDWNNIPRKGRNFMIEAGFSF